MICEKSPSIFCSFQLLVLGILSDVCWWVGVWFKAAAEIKSIGRSEACQSPSGHLPVAESSRCRNPWLGLYPNARSIQKWSKLLQNPGYRQEGIYLSLDYWHEAKDLGDKISHPTILGLLLSTGRREPSCTPQPNCVCYCTEPESWGLLCEEWNSRQTGSEPLSHIPCWIHHPETAN